MKALHFRYGWIARPRLAELLPVSDEIASMRQLLERRRRLLEQPNSEAMRRDAWSRDALRVAAWFQKPRVDRPPSLKAVRSTRRLAEEADDRLLYEIQDWVGEAHSLLDGSRAEKSPPLDEMISFLEALARTDFPSLLSWRQARLAARLFVADGHGAQELAPTYRRAGRATVQAARTCVGYALAGVGRLAPRQAWVGVGFGRFEATSSEESIAVVRDRERICVEPDLAWIERHWRDLEPMPLAAGTRPWSYLDERVRIQSDPRVERYHAEIVEQLRELANQVEAEPWHFEAIQGFLTATEALLRESVGEEIWGEDPHAWWVSRYLPEEQSVAQECSQQFRQDFVQHRAGLRERRLLFEPDEDWIHPVLLPYPYRLRQRSPAAIRVEAEEFFDWVAEIGGGEGADLPFVPPTAEPGAALVSWIDERGSRHQFVDPSPRRASERSAVCMVSRPLFSEPQVSDGQALRPPLHRVDNRLVRLQETERDPAEVSPGESVSFHSALLDVETTPLLALELASARYARAADLVPQLVEQEAAEQLSFGRVWARDGVWLLEPVESRELLRKLGTARALAGLYHLEVHEVLGQPAWLDVVANGKHSALPTQSLVAWDYLVHLLRTTSVPLALIHPKATTRAPLIVDAAGGALPSQVLAR